MTVERSKRRFLIPIVFTTKCFCVFLFLFVSCTRDKQRYTIILVLQFLRKKGYKTKKNKKIKRESGGGGGGGRR